MPDISDIAVVLTSIAAPNSVMRAIAADSLSDGRKFYVIGDTKSPASFELEGCSFSSVEQQLRLGFRFAESCPTRHYARKNIGYLLAIREGAKVLLETDDDNLPGSDFYNVLDPEQSLPVLKNAGWVNVFRYYTSKHIWPRGFPLDAVSDPIPSLPAKELTYCPIQQGLADDNPDVDAVYRLLMQLPVRFEGKHRIALGEGSWCPFNSQNTAFFAEAFPLLYLPSHCSFRMTDIWRSFVAQRIAWENGWSILFREATVEQFRNDHSLMKDFEDEIPGYLHNRKMTETLGGLTLKSGPDAMPDNLRICYEALVREGWVGEKELPLLNLWLSDLQSITTRTAS